MKLMGEEIVKVTNLREVPRRGCKIICVNFLEHIKERM